MVYEVCPICKGKGLLAKEFYPDTKKNKNKFVSCRSCYGSGILKNTENNLYYFPKYRNPDSFPYTNNPWYWWGEQY